MTTTVAHANADDLAITAAAPRLVRLQRAAAYAAAAAMVPYVLIKLSWVLGAAAGVLDYDDDMGLPVWLALNTVTIGMAAAAIALCFVLARDWGQRIPARPLLGSAWLATGFLVPMVPFMVLSAAFGGGSAGGRTPERGSTMPGWESALISVSFAGLALGLAIALPLYFLQRWPAAFRGRMTMVSRQHDGRLAKRSSRAAVAGCASVAALQFYWLAGGTAGLAEPSLRERQWYLLTANTMIWAAAGAWSAWSLSERRPGRVVLALPMTLGWLASGLLFTWSAWRLAFTVYLVGRGGESAWPENLVVASLWFVTSIIAGTSLVGILRATYLERFTPSHGEPVPPTRDAARASSRSAAKPGALSTGARAGSSRTL